MGLHACTLASCVPHKAEERVRRQPAAARRRPLNLGAASEYQDTLPFLLACWDALRGSLRPATTAAIVPLVGGFIRLSCYKNRFRSIERIVAIIHMLDPVRLGVLWSMPGPTRSAVSHHILSRTHMSPASLTYPTDQVRIFQIARFDSPPTTSCCQDPRIPQVYRIRATGDVAFLELQRGVRSAGRLPLTRHPLILTLLPTTQNRPV